MLSLDEAWKYVQSRLSPLPDCTVALGDAVGLVAAEAVIATESIPPFANSAVDGFGVRRADVNDGPNRGLGTELVVLGEVAAGHVSSIVVGPGEAVRIMTGAPIPAGVDAIVMVEDTEILSDSTSQSSDLPSDGLLRERVRITRPDAAGTHIRPEGDDLMPGDVVLERGTVLTPAHVGLLSTVGQTHVTVVRRPVVGVISTGDELVQPSTVPGPGQIRDSNRPQLLAAVAAAGCIPKDLGCAPDDAEAIEAALRAGVADCDAVLTSGGVSMGDHDLVKVVLDQIGDMRWMQVAIKPAKPFAFGLIDGVPVFGLPGNPVSSLVSFELFARPGLRVLGGHVVTHRRHFQAIAAQDFRRRSDGKTHFVRASLGTGPGGELLATPTAGQGSHQLSGLASAEALVVLSDGDGALAGDPIQLMLLG